MSEKNLLIEFKRFTKCDHDNLRAQRGFDVRSGWSRKEFHYLLFFAPFEPKAQKFFNIKSKMSQFHWTYN